MTVGLSQTNFIHRVLNHVRGTTAGGAAFTQPTSLFVSLHTGDPGAAGTTLPSAVTTRSTITFAAAASSAIAITGTNPSWSMTATETISHIAVWDASTAGNFLWSATLSVSKSVQAGDTLTLTSCGLSLGATAA